MNEAPFNVSGMRRHAYLIMAHKDDLCFRCLVSMLDDPRNDIFVHMDKKCRDFDEDSIAGLVKRSSLFFIKRRNCTWGGERV